MALDWLQTGTRDGLLPLENWLERERDQLPLWLPVGLGAGIGLWFVLPDAQAWLAVILAGIGASIAGLVLGWHQRSGRALFWAGMAMACGCGLVWARAEFGRAPVIDRPVIASVTGQIIRVEKRPEGDGVRLIVAPSAVEGLPEPLPKRLRISVSDDHLPRPLYAGEAITVRARLMPPPGPAVPGAYDFARTAWFQQIGGTGKALDPPQIKDGMTSAEPGLRERLSAHVRAQLSGSAGGIAAAFASGDRAGISPDDEDAMRASGLTHLLSISGLHITAVVAAAMLIALRLLALSPWLAIRWPLVLISAGIGALAGVGYTLLTGAEVPTVRSCIAALLVLGGLALGREAMTLRLVATGALLVLLLWPESLVGPSFQLSFAAITAIVALHEVPWIKRVTSRHEEGLFRRGLRVLFGLLITGLAVELALAPIALFHFHKSGLYGALANIIAIPLTTFVIMPFEALALAFDIVGLGAPFWWITGQGLDLLLWLARIVAAQPGAVAALPSVPLAAYALMAGGGLWLLLWRSRQRLLGIAPFLAGALWALLTPVPDLLVTGDGRHLAVRTDDGPVGLLRSRAGDYVRDLLAERSGETEPLYDLERLPDAQCGRDLCLVDIRQNGRTWRVAATRSAHRLPWEDFTRTCAKADIIISDRRLPQGCLPRWIKADKAFLAETGGLAVTLKTGRVETVRRSGDAHPWIASGAR